MLLSIHSQSSCEFVCCREIKMSTNSLLMINDRPRWLCHDRSCPSWSAPYQALLTMPHPPSLNSSAPQPARPIWAPSSSPSRLLCPAQVLCPLPLISPHDLGWQCCHFAPSQYRGYFVQGLPTWRPTMSPSLDRLIVVVRHAIWIGAWADNVEDEETGLLGSWQGTWASLFCTHMAHGWACHFALQNFAFANKTPWVPNHHQRPSSPRL